MSATIARPQATEYAPFYEAYISKVPEGDLLRLLGEQRRTTAELLAAIPEDRGEHRYAPDKWSVKEVVGHVTDAERIFLSRPPLRARRPHTARWVR